MFDSRSELFMFKYVSLLKCLSHYVVIDFKSHIISKNACSLIVDIGRIVGNIRS